VSSSCQQRDFRPMEIDQCQRYVASGWNRWGDIQHELTQGAAKRRKFIDDRSQLPPNCRAGALQPPACSQVDRTAVAKTRSQSAVLAAATYPALSLHALMHRHSRGTCLSLLHRGRGCQVRRTLHTGAKYILKSGAGECALLGKVSARTRCPSIPSEFPSFSRLQGG
jgi:hypothetical protein